MGLTVSPPDVNVSASVTWPAIIRFGWPPSRTWRGGQEAIRDTRDAEGAFKTLATSRARDLRSSTGA